MKNVLIKNNLLVILDELATRPSGAYASDIESSIKTNYQGYNIALGTIIISLNRLLKMDLVFTKDDSYKTNGLIRKRYYTTGAGKQVLIDHRNSFRSFNLNNELSGLSFK